MMKDSVAERVRIAAVLSLFLLLTGLSGAADAKKLQVVAARADIHLDPDAKSPVVATLENGTVLTLGSVVKSRINWFYVFFTSPKSGQTRSGYVLDSLVRQLYQNIRVIEISSGEETSEPKELDLNDTFQPIVSWGAKKAIILQSEGRPVSQELVNGQDIVRYERKLMAQRCLIEYLFENGRLVSSRYRLLENYADNNRYIEDYKKIKDYLISKIGEPRSDKITWQDPSDMNNYQSWGAELSLGRLEFRSEWESPDKTTEILVTLAGVDKRISFGAELSPQKIKTASF